MGLHGGGVIRVSGRGHELKQPAGEVGWRGPLGGGTSCQRLDPKTLWRRLHPAWPWRAGAVARPLGSTEKETEPWILVRGFGRWGGLHMAERRTPGTGLEFKR